MPAKISLPLTGLFLFLFGSCSKRPPEPASPATTLPATAGVTAAETPDLPEKIGDQIDALCADGDALAEQTRFPEALTKYNAAWDLLPEPKSKWEAATFILTAIGDVKFLSGDFKAARDSFSSAMHCPDAIGNPFIHFRLGQCQFELGNQDRAADELTRAYMGSGYDLFSDADPKYFRFLKTRLKPPPDGWEDEKNQ